MPSNFTWHIYIDFDRDGTFSAGDEVTGYVMTAEWNVGMRDAFQLCADEMRLTMVLRNDDKRFSPENAAGPHYGDLLPLRPVKVDCVRNAVTKTMYVGWVDNFDPATMENSEQVCVVSANGPKQFLQSSEVYLELMQNVTAEEVLEAIFEQVVFPVTTGNIWRLGLAGSTELGVTTFLVDIEDVSYDFDAGAQTFTYVGDTWQEGINAYDAILRLMTSERGHFYFDRGGTPVFKNRQAFQAAYLNSGTVDNMMALAPYSFGTDIYNVVRVSCSPRQITEDPVTLWAMDTPVRVDAGETKTIRARYSDASGAIVAGYNVGTPSITADSGIVLDSFTSLARSAEAVFVNSAATHGSVTVMDITGQKMTSWNRVEVEEIDQQSISQNGKRPLPINCDLLDSEEDARYVAQYELARRKDPRGQIHSLTLKERSTLNVDMMFTLTVADRIRVIENQTQHDGDYIIVGEEWALRDGLDNVDVKWNLEPASTFQASFLDVVGTAELDQTARLGF